MTKQPIGGLIPEGEFSPTLFGENEIRRIFHNGKWYLCIVDVVKCLAETDNAASYWGKMKAREKQRFPNWERLKFLAPNGKEYAMEAADPEGILRIVQSIPSPKAEPFKRWLAKVGYERIQEDQDPTIAIKRGILRFKAQGREDSWINARVKGILERKALTDMWKERGITHGKEYANLTAANHLHTFGRTPAEHKSLKGLGKKESLRNNMTEMEVILTMLAERSTQEIAEVRDAMGFDENMSAAIDGGRVAGTAREAIQQRLGRSVVSSDSYAAGRTKKISAQIVPGLKDPSADNL
ncbi:MAG: Bro-N domain-containing protein [Planctomycetales bacterium]|nr:Bro-N domain-containing protein [bacterium]UNM07032.1 MAG: Bro-N domain-containing protein [Planctomycetales bacterium]